MRLRLVPVLVLSSGASCAPLHSSNLTNATETIGPHLSTIWSQAHKALPTNVIPSALLSWAAATSTAQTAPMVRNPKAVSRSCF